MKRTNYKPMNILIVSMLSALLITFTGCEESIDVETKPVDNLILK